jgi:hypothetical protein
MSCWIAGHWNVALSASCRAAIWPSAVPSCRRLATQDRPAQAPIDEGHRIAEEGSEERESKPEAPDEATGRRTRRHGRT